MIAGPFIEPPRRHHPGVLSAEVAFLRLWNGSLIPRMALIDRVTERIFLYKGLALIPILIIGGTQQDAKSNVNINEVSCDEFTVHNDPRGDKHCLPPLIHRLVVIIANIRILE